MWLRTYTVSQKYIKNKQGDIGVYKKKIKKWIRTRKPYKPQKRGLAKEPIYSTRFGFLDMYNRKQQHEIKCPSGYTIAQCFNKLRMMWLGYHGSRVNGEKIEQMEKYAKEIQSVQKDLGIKTTSFPHLGIYGDEFILKDKSGKTVVFEDHSALKEEQEGYEKWQAENSRKIDEMLLKPHEGQAIVTIADDIYPFQIQYNEEKPLPELLKTDEIKGQKIITRADNTPFHKKPRRRIKKNGVSTITIADDVFPYEKIDTEIEDIVPCMLKPERDKKVVVIADDFCWS